ncbi:hypothetical protein [Desulfopila inferna]|uniref:hypothetical protein n=1 Tax=Desulfopila inferna TaxID=468528 RepID=UPI0019643F85|nr:hypothetical protein [Desulfopila inferna]MBM9604220.1 hypothetical protein [Desulfopila inferna]
MTVKVKLLVGYARGGEVYRKDSIQIKKPKDEKEIDGVNILKIPIFDDVPRHHKLTGNKVFFFDILATFKFEKFSIESNLFELNLTNYDEETDFWEWRDDFTGEMSHRDWEGVKLNPILLTKVIDSLKADIERGVLNDDDLEPENLIWHKWAINALESIPDFETKHVLVYFKVNK